MWDWLSSWFAWVPAQTTDWVYYALLMVVLVVGWLLNILGLPGLWLMVLGHVLFAWVTVWDRFVGLQSVIALIVLAVIAEVIEFAAGAAGSANAGGSKRGMIGAIVGGLVGGIVGSILIPIPIVGTIIGAVGGSFAGAAGVERLIDADSGRAVRVGFGAAKGRLAGIIIKSVFGVVMAIVSLVTALPIGAATSSPATSPAFSPPTLPATQSATTSPSQ